MGNILENKGYDDKIKKLSIKKLNLINTMKLFNIFMKIREKDRYRCVKLFINEYYNILEDMPDDFYELILDKIYGDKYLEIFDKFIDRDKYMLVSYLKYDNEDTDGLNEVITINQYYSVSKRYVNKIIDLIKNLDGKGNNNLDLMLEKEAIWLLRRRPTYSELEYRNIAYKIILSIGLDNGIELLSNKYGDINYEKVFFMFNNLDVRIGISNQDIDIFNIFLFSNKKDYNNVVRMMLNGDFIELFLNFDYFYNNFSYFVRKIGSRLNKNKVRLLLNDRYLTGNVSSPEMTGDILDDMLSSYYCKYDVLDTPKEIVYDKNYYIYDKYLRNKYKSSIPMIDNINKDGYLCEVISFCDPRNLVLGYRSGNCFRINGDARILFNNFLKSDHMRLVSISTNEYKDFAMMLVYRNGNILIGQGIEVSKRVSNDVKGKKLYDICRMVLKEMMDYMNMNGDCIVATIIGSSNENVSNYNKQILPFLVSPILDNSCNYYNGIYNYQCLLDIKEGCSLYDIKLYIPEFRYYDKRDKILYRMKGDYNNYMEIEKRLIAQRFWRMKQEGSFDFYQRMYNHNEIYTCCNKDWYITLYDDMEIDSFIIDGNEIARCEYDNEMDKIMKMIKDCKFDNLGGIGRKKRIRINRSR